MHSIYKTIVLLLVVFTTTTNYSQNLGLFEDDKNLVDLIVKDPTESTYRKMPIVLKYTGYEDKTNRLLEADEEFDDIRLEKYNGKKVYNRCWYNYKQGIKYDNLVKEGVVTLKKMKANIEAATSENEHSYHQSSYNYTLSYLKRYESYANNYLAKADSCNIAEKKRKTSLGEEFSSLQTELFNHYKSTYLSDSDLNFYELKYLTQSEDPYATTKLDLDYKFRKLTEVPKSIELLENLTHLKLSLPKLKKIPDNIGALKNLTRLDIWQTKLSDIPQTLQNLKKLERLSIEAHHLNLDFLPKLTNLNDLDLSTKDEYSKLPEDIGQLTQLTRLNLTGFNNLKSVPESITSLNNLKHLEIGKTQKKVFRKVIKKLKSSNPDIYILIQKNF